MENFSSNFYTEPNKINNTKNVWEYLFFTQSLDIALRKYIRAIMLFFLTIYFIKICLKTILIKK